MSDVIRDVDDTFEDIERKLKHVMESLEEEIADILTRVAFHREKALRGVEFIIEHDFIRGWEVIEERTLSIATSGFYEIVGSMDRHFHQSNTSAILHDGSGDVSFFRDVLWLIIDADLVNKLDVIQTARTNITKINNAYVTGKPIIKYAFSPNQRYDMSFIPMDIVHHNRRSQTYYFNQIMNVTEDYAQAITTLRHIGKVYVSDGKLDKEKYEEAKGNFISAAKAVNHRIFQYRDRIVQKSLDIVKERISDFVSLNETLTSNYAGLKYLVNSTTSLVQGQKLSQWRHIKEAAARCKAYLQDFSASKTDLSKFLNSYTMQEDLIKLNNFFTNLRSRATDLIDLWVKTQQSYNEVYSSIISETMTHEFYNMLNNDTKELTADPENNTEIYFPIFGSLLNVSEQELNNTNITDFFRLLNADVPDIDLDKKTQEIDKAFRILMEQFDLTKYIKNRDEDFLAIMKILQNSLKHFETRNSLGLEFYGYDFNL